MDELVQLLSQGTHLIRADRAKSPAELRTSIDNGFVMLRFPNTRGGTTLGVRLDKSRCQLIDEASQPRDRVHLVGSLILNYNKVELRADMDVNALEGTGSLELIADEAAWRA